MKRLNPIEVSTNFMLKKHSFVALIAAICLTQFPSTGIAHDGHSHDSASHHRLHFSHPLIAESVSPDTKVRLDYGYRNAVGGSETATQNRILLEAEYAFYPSFSIETDIPFVVANPAMGTTQSNLGNLGISFKFANFAFAEHNLLLGYGIEFGLPTGNDAKGIGSDHIVEMETFLNAGYMLEKLEIEAFATFGIPTNLQSGDDSDSELGYNLSLLYHIRPWLQGLLEMDGQTILNGEEEGATVVNITPGVKLRPFSTSGLNIGIAASVPVTQEKEFDARAQLSLFYHF